MFIIKYIWAKLTGGKLVWLKDYNERITLTIAYINPWGELFAERWWPWNIHTVKLGADGEVLNGGYVKKWKFY